MNHHKPGSIVVGVDVGGPRKGFHAVALQDGQYPEKLSTLIGEEVAAWYRRLKASVVGIDAPCRWSLTSRARPCERALAAEGLHTFSTPSQVNGAAPWSCADGPLAAYCRDQPCLRTPSHN